MQLVIANMYGLSYLLVTIVQIASCLAVAPANAGGIADGAAPPSAIVVVDDPEEGAAVARMSKLAKEKYYSTSS